MTKNRYRIPAEFEPQDSVLIVWSPDEFSAKGLDVDKVSVEVIYHLVDNVELHIVCTDEATLDRASTKLQARGIDTQRIKFHVHEAYTIYPRDFGAEILVDGLGNKVLANFNFMDYCFLPPEKSHLMDWGLKEFNKYHAGLVGIEKKADTWLVSEGGDRDFNGDGIMIAIEETEVSKRNPGKTKGEVETEFKRLLHLDKIIWIPRCTYDDENVILGPIPGPDGGIAYRAASANGHIDEMCRFVDRNTVLVASISDEEAEKDELAALNKERLDEAYEVLKNATDQYGNPFRIVKMPVPEPIYIEIDSDDFAYHGLQDFAEIMDDTLLDGSKFPKDKYTVLPAMSYCNFLVNNNIVLAQSYYQEGLPEIVRIKDEKVVSILKELFPDRKVIAIPTLALNMCGGGIHCHTRNIPL